MLVPWGLGGMLVPWGQGVGWVPRLEFPRVPSIAQPQGCDGVEVRLPNLQPCFMSSSGQIAGGARGLLSATPSKRCCSSGQWQLCAERGRIGPPHPFSPLLWEPPGAGSGSDPTIRGCRRCRGLPQGRVPRMIVSLWLAYIAARKGTGVHIPTDSAPVSRGRRGLWPWLLGHFWSLGESQGSPGSPLPGWPGWPRGGGGRVGHGQLVSAQGEDEAGECPQGRGGAWALRPGHFFEDRASTACRDATLGAPTASLQLCSLRRVKSCSPGCSRGCWKSGQSPGQSPKESHGQSPRQSPRQSLQRLPQSPSKPVVQAPRSAPTATPGTPINPSGVPGWGALGGLPESRHSLR